MNVVLFVGIILLDSTTLSKSSNPQCERPTEEECSASKPGALNPFPECGRSMNQFHDKAGVLTARRGQFPWHVYYVHPGGNCGGSILDNRHVLTSASCIPTEGDKGNVYVGIICRNVEEDECTRQTVAVESTIVHPSFDNETRKNEVAILKLNSSLRFNNYVNPICLPTDEAETYIDATAYVSGFGETSVGDILELRYAKMSVISDEVCRIGNERNILCAGTFSFLGLYFGEAGGPLVVQDRETNISTLVGVVRLEGKSLQGYTISFYSRVTSFESWIKNILNKTFREQTNKQPSENKATSKEALNTAIMIMLIAINIITLC